MKSNGGRSETIALATKVAGCGDATDKNSPRPGCRGQCRLTAFVQASSPPIMILNRREKSARMTSRWKADRRRAHRWIPGVPSDQIGLPGSLGFCHSRVSDTGSQAFAPRTSAGPGRPRIGAGRIDLRGTRRRNFLASQAVPTTRVVRATVKACQSGSAKMSLRPVWQSFFRHLGFSTRQVRIGERLRHVVRVLICPKIAL
jgi:hypothetical protein